MKRAVVIGKFLPPHRGHKLLIDTASAEADDVTVIVCHRAGQEIPGEVRAAWLRRIHPRANVIVVPDHLDPDDSAAWAEFTTSVLGWRPDVVFTSEAYGEEYARLMGSAHRLVDLARSRVPVSATRIREGPLASWEFLEPCVRAHFALRIVAVGAESTGTTTIARALAEHYRTPWVPEYGRMYYEGRQPSAEPWRTDEFVHIAMMQNLIEDQLAETANRILVCDTDSFATSVWHERYMGVWADDVEACSSGRRVDLYLLTGDDVPFVQDGTRDGESVRDWMHRRFSDLLSTRHVPVVELRGSHEERMARAVAACDTLLAANGVTDAAM